MPKRLTRTSPYPPGEFSYNQPLADGSFHFFAGSGLSITQQARMNVLPFRQKNGLPRASLEEALDDINVYTCQRLGDSPRYCAEAGAIQVQSNNAGGGCGGCGAVLA